MAAAAAAGLPGTGDVARPPIMPPALPLLRGEMGGAWSPRPPRPPRPSLPPLPLPVSSGN